VGIEYMLEIPSEHRLALHELLSTSLPALLAELDPLYGDPFPNAIVELQPEGVYVCDTLSDTDVAAKVIRAVTDLILMRAPHLIVRHA
jgi:hypothetical protein